MSNPDTIKILRKILQSHIPDKSYRAFIFGSRAKGTNRKFSDVDLGIIGPKPLSSRVFVTIQDEFEKSDLPYKVDFVDFSSVSDKFRKQALSNIINI